MKYIFNTFLTNKTFRIEVIIKLILHIFTLYCTLIVIKAAMIPVMGKGDIDNDSNDNNESD